MKPFIILTFPRTGSTYIRTWFNHHSMIRCHGELFLPSYKHVDGFKYHCETIIGDKILAPILSNFYIQKIPFVSMPQSYVDSYMQRLLYDQNFPSPWVPFHDKDQPETVGSLNKPWVGFKAMYNHVYCNRHLQRWIEEKGFTILHLVRENLLKQYVSLRRMKVTGKSHSCTKVTKATPVAIDIHRLEHHIEKMMKRIEYFRNIYATNHPYMEFTYESYFRNPVKIRKQITTFMDVPDEEMQDSKNQKTSTNVLEREIANATEVVRWIEKTPYAHFLEAYS